MIATSTLHRLLRVSVFALLSAACLPAQDGGDPDAWFTEAEAALAKGRDRKALAALEKILAADPADAEALDLAITVTMNVGEYEKADAWSAKWLERDAGNRGARLRRAEVLARLGRSDQVLAVLEPLLARTTPEPADAPALDFEAVVLAARAHESRGRRAEAERLYDGLVSEAQRVVIRDPHALAALARANVFFGGKQGLNNADKMLAGEVQPALKKDPWPRIQLGILYRDSKYRQDAAHKEFEDALKLRPSLAEAHWQLALNYAVWMQPDKERESLDQCLRINPRHPEALAWRASSLLGDMELDKAAEVLDQSLKVDPACREALSLRAALSYMRGDRAGFEEGLEAVLAVDPGYADAHLHLARVLNERRRWPECLAQARLAVALDPKNPRALDERGRYAFFLGHEKEGDESVRRANEIDAFAHPWRNNMVTVMAELRRNYEDAESGHFHHRVHKLETKAFAPLLLPFAEESYRELSAKYGFVPEGVEEFGGKVLVESFRDHDGFSARTLGFQHLGASGVCFGSVIFSCSPNALPLGTNSWARTFHHELAHTMTLGLSKGRTPRWLTEGLSTYEEGVKDPSWVRPMERELFDAYHLGGLFGVLHFDAAFSTPRIGFAYFQGGLVCEWMVKRFGFDKVLAMLRAYGEDKGTAEILRSVLGVDADEFDRGFREFVGERLKDVRMIPRASAERIRDLEARLREAPDDVEALIPVAAARIAAKLPLDAEELLLRAQKAAPEDPRVTFLFGVIAFNAKRTDVARKHFEAALAKGYRDHDLHVAYSQLLLKAGESEKAIEQLRLAIETFQRATGPSDPRLALAKLLEAGGQGEEAVRLYEDYLRLDFENIKIRKTLLNWYAGRDDVAAQRRHLEAILLVNPLDLPTRLGLGTLLAKAGEHARALAEFEAGLGAVEANKDVSPAVRADLHVGAARALLATGGDRDDVADHVQAALTLVPGHAAARELEAELRRGQPPGAGDQK